MKQLSYLLLLPLLLSACSQYSNSPTSTAYHNTTAKYNAYLQARDLMVVAESGMIANHKDDFSEILPILIPIDSVENQAYRTQFDAIFKKTSLIAERHQNAKWLDDAYLLMGKVRLYRENYTEAIETFKYINTQGSDENDKHAALVALMRAYVERDDLNAGLKVAEYLRGEPLNKNNARDFYLTKAYLHQLRGEFELAAPIAEEALKLMKKGEVKARVLYATGQMYEALGQPDKAVGFYQAVQKNNPTYDLSFNANLNGLMATGQGTGKVDDNFKDMLTDRKNADLKDKIYLTMAQRAISQKNTTAAIDNLRKAVAASNGSQTTLSQAYLALAEIYYNTQKYELAKAYYDSTMTVLPPKATDYVTIEAKKKTLDDFVKQLSTIRTEDSLQRLAQMNPVALGKYLDKIINDKEQQQKEAAEMAEKIAKRANTGTLSRGNTDFTNPESSFYFYNNTLVLQGRSEFGRRWGNRKLEDNWRRANKESAGLLSSETNDARVVKLDDGNSLTRKTDSWQIGEKERQTMKDGMMRKIPFGQAEMQDSRNKQEEATFSLGKIYKLNLNEPQNAIKTFEELLSKFPNTKHEEETLYLLCLLTENQGNNASWKQKLNERFADSYYARLLARGANPNQTTPSTGGAADAQRLYATAYELYQDGKYNDALIAVDNGLRNYANDPLQDKYSLLKIILLGKTQQIDLYKRSLEDFVKDYPNSPLVGMAKEMRAKAQ